MHDSDLFLLLDRVNGSRSAEWRQMQKLARGETEPEAPPRVIRHGELQIRGNQTTYNLNSILANNIKASMYYNKIRQ